MKEKKTPKHRWFPIRILSRTTSGHQAKSINRDVVLSERSLKNLNSPRGLQALLSSDKINLRASMRRTDYIRALKKYQVELIRMQAEIIEKKQRVIVIFEGRDAAGKGGAIRRITERINPRHFRIVALPKPSGEEKTQWYFQRYINKFPKAGEMVFFDRSWYNRAAVEPVNGFCTDEEYQTFMGQVNEFEKMIVESGIQLVKVYMSITKDEQARRFEEIKSNPLKQWKMTPVDERAQELWEKYTHYKEAMFNHTHTEYGPWKIIEANKKTKARIEAVKYLLEAIPYDKERPV